MAHDTQSSPTMVRRFLRFGITGLCVTGVHAAIAVLLITLVSVTPTLANGLAFIVATLISYTVNTIWSFSATPSRSTLARFLVVSVTGCGLTMTVAGIADLAGLHYLAGIGCVVLTVPPVTFLMHNYWTYR